MTFRLSSTRAIDWCMNCHIWMRKNFRLFFGKGPHHFIVKIELNLFLIQMSVCPKKLKIGGRGFQSEGHDTTYFQMSQSKNETQNKET
jgi:hypothetical protein